jgi:alkylated DNA repair dioxygenase AlkB
MKRSGHQYKLFDAGAALPQGLLYKADFITAEEEEMLIAYIYSLNMHPARAGEYVGRRKVKGFGWGWDERKQKFVHGPPLPIFFQRFARKIAKWLDISKSRVVEALINEYPPGAGVGWHRDNEGFEHVVGISLAGWCKMRFRPLKLRTQRNSL